VSWQVETGHYGLDMVFGKFVESGIFLAVGNGSQESIAQNDDISKEMKCTGVSTKQARPRARQEHSRIRQVKPV
jgi:hypothetical protein